MAYTIRLSNFATDPTATFAVAEGQPDTTHTSLILIGKNFAGYGQFINENYLHILENFSNTTAPKLPLEGQIWWDSSSQNLKVRSGTGSSAMWKSVTSSTAASDLNKPAHPIVGDLWWNTDTKQLNAWNGTSWTLIGPAYTTSQSVSGSVPTTVLDTSGNAHTVDEYYVSNILVFIVSKDPDFRVANLTGFDWIRCGFNMVSSIGSGNTLTVPNYWPTRSGSSVTTTTTTTTIAPTTTTTASTSPPNTAPVFGIPGPQITPAGSQTPGIRITCSTGNVSGNPTPTFTYRWHSILNNLVELQNDSRNYYDILVGDVGDGIVCEVTATNIAGSATQASSNGTDVIAGTTTTTPA